MHAVTAQAAYVALTMGRAFKVGVLALVAAEALRVHLLGGRLSGIENLRYVPSAIHVGLAWTVAAFAGHARVAV